MSQFWGYLLAAIGPLLAASLFQYNQNWLSTIELCAALSLLTSLFGYIASQDRVIDIAELRLGKGKNLLISII